MEQAQYWMWMKRKHDLNTRSSFGDMREEEAFAEDVAGCIWPPRCYSCTFCKREFKSAQALGGHMNVHRKDRAILKFSPNLDHSPKLVPFPNHFLSPQNSPSNSNLLKGQSGVWNHPAYTGSDEGPILNHLAYTSSEEWSTLNKRHSDVLNHPAYTRSDEGPILNKRQSGVLNHQVYTRSDEGPILNKRQYGVSNLPAYTRLDEGSSILNKRQSGVLSHREYTISNAEMLGHLQTFDQNSDSNQEILSTSPLSLTRVSSIGENHPTETLPRESGSFLVGKQGYFTVSDPRYNETTSPKISYLKSSFSKKEKYYDEEADDLSVNLSFLVYPSSQEINGSIIADEMIQSCKRQRLNDGDDEPPFTYLRSWNSGSDKDRCRLVGVDEPLKVMSPNPHLEEDLDLELRLGDPPKVKY